ncbi:MAG: hypothetical protein GX555_15215 [Actinomycetales bacterium]|nr:hypothetical protein [Actinomycetales bacterium]
MQSLPIRASWWLTAASYVWVWGVLSVAWPPRPWHCLALALLFGLAAWVTTQRPLPGVLLTAGGLILLGLLGIGPETPVPLGPVFITLVVVGYLCSPRWSVWAIPFLLVTTAVPAQWEIYSVVFGGLLLILPWWFGVQLRLRDGRRRQAVANAERLSRVDPSVRAQRAAATEREEVAAAAFGAIGRSLEEMTETATVSRETLRLEGITRIHDLGEGATRRLRELLVLLRERDTGDEDESPTPGTDRSPEEAGVPSWRRVLRDGWPVALLLLDVVTVPWAVSALGMADPPDLPTMPFLLVVILPLAVTVFLRSRFTVGALLAAAVILLVGTLAGIADVGREGFWLYVVGVALSWSAGRAGTRSTLLAWLVFSVTTWSLVWLDTQYYLWIQISVHVLSYGAAAVWAGHHAVEIEHRTRALSRQAEIEAAEQAAVARERLRLARDLHDAASHAVGTMMMQANAARVLRDRDPGAARAALDAIADIGRESAAELQGIRSAAPPAPRMLAEAATGADGRVDLAEAVAPLVATARRGGAQVSTMLDVRTDPSPQDVALLLRVVREGLANAMRHAPGSEVTLEVVVDATRVTVAVGNGPAGRVPGQDVPVTTSVGLGLGLRGLRELITERGGELATSSDGDHHELRADYPTSSTARPVVLP